MNDPKAIFGAFKDFAKHLTLKQDIPLRRFVVDIDGKMTDVDVEGKRFNLRVVLQDDSVLNVQGHSHDHVVYKLNQAIEDYAEKQGWIKPEPVDVLQRAEVKNYIIGTSKDFDSSAQLHFVRLTLQDGAISSGMHPNPMIAEEKAITAAIEYSIKKGWIKEVSPYFSFSKALELLKQGDKITRKGWNGADQWLSISCPDTKDVAADNFWSPHNAEFARQNGGSAKVAPCITLKNAQGMIIMGWIPSAGDLFADDWMIAQ